MLYITVGILVFAFLYLLCLKGRTGHPGLQQLRGWNYAHRGLHTSGVPENSLAAFRAAVAQGYGSELDIHLMKDGNLAVIHDSSLKRIAGADVQIEDLTAADLQSYRLEGTEETIPLFSQVLEVYNGKAPLIVELKSAGGNHKELCAAACKLLDNYHGAFCMESFDPQCIFWLRKHRPDIIRGQLSENWMKHKVKWSLFTRIVMTYHISNLLTRPDFIAYRFAHRKTFGTAICRKLWGIQGVSWTLRSRAEYDTAVKEGWLPIFENFTV